MAVELTMNVCSRGSYHMASIFRNPYDPVARPDYKAP